MNSWFYIIVCVYSAFVCIVEISYQWLSVQNALILGKLFSDRYWSLLAKMFGHYSYFRHGVITQVINYYWECDCHYNHSILSELFN